jgi:hypothetical protein
MAKESPFTIVYEGAAEDESFEETSHQPVAEMETSAGSLKPKSTRKAKKGTRKVSAKKASTKTKGAKPITAKDTVAKQTSTDRYLGAVSAAAPDLLSDLNSLNPHLRRTLLTSSFGVGVREDVNEVLGRLRPVVEDISKGGQSVTVAFLDLDARVGGLPKVIESLNTAQTLFTFLDLQAALPAGLLIPSNKFSSWARHRVGWKRVTKGERDSFEDNLMFNDFYKYAQAVRQTSGVDYLIGITQYMIAIEEEEENAYYWNYFSSAEERIILASTYDLREYALKSGRPFEIAVTLIALAQLLSQMNKIDYHRNRGCFFDENIDRSSIVKSLKNAKIEPKCFDKIEPNYREAVDAMMTALRNYQKPDTLTAAPTKKKRQAKKRNDSYWLDQLKRLSEKLKKSGNR